MYLSDLFTSSRNQSACEDVACPDCNFIVTKPNCLMSSTGKNASSFRSYLQDQQISHDFRCITYVVYLENPGIHWSKNLAFYA